MSPELGLPFSPDPRLFRDLRCTPHELQSLFDQALSNNHPIKDGFNLVIIHHLSNANPEDQLFLHYVQLDQQYILKTIKRGAGSCFEPIFEDFKEDHLTISRDSGEPLIVNIRLVPPYNIVLRN